LTILKSSYQFSQFEKPLTGVMIWKLVSCQNS
jgi:hypothetical protein